MELIEKLQKAGLTGNEAKVYLLLTKKGILSANGIAKQLSMDRTLTYTVLNHLIKKGQVSYVIKEKKKFFTACEAENLINPIRSTEILVNELIKEIKTIKKEDNQEIEINIYEGKQAIRNWYNLFIKYKEMLAFGATGRAYDSLYEAPALVKDMIKKGVHGRIITSKKYKNHPMTKIKDVKVRFLDYDSESTTTIFGDYIMIHLIKEVPLSVLIKSKDIANTYRKHFEVLWNSAK
ncbi:MAG: TrmB family transcriptional regulator [Candidatus Woesearchaeota archaeon]